MTNLIIYIVITVIVNLLLISSIFYFFLISQRKKTTYLLAMQRMREEQQNLLIEAAVKSEESERHRIAEELHDEVGAMLSATKLHFSAAESPKLNDDEKRIFARSRELLDESIQKVRSISHNLHSGILKELGLNEAIRHFVHKTCGPGTVTATLHLDDHYEPANPDREITIYRLLQELLNNVLKHSKATRLNIETRQLPEKFTLTVSHNGHGLSQQEFERLRYQGNGLGLKNIQNRIILLKGKILYRSSGEEHSVSVEVPQNPTS
jgi:signal transduction histidine kinase